jgi:putative transposase
MFMAKKKIAKARRYTPAERAQALARANEIGPSAAGRELGIPEGTICNWRYDDKRAAKKLAAAEVADKSPVPVSPATNGASTKPKVVAKSYTPSLRARVLEYVAQHGVTAAAKEFGVTRFSIYDWQRKVELHAQGKAVDSPVTGSDEDQAALRDQRILKEWRSSAGLGPSQVRNQLRRQGFKVSIHTVRCVLEQHGYVTPKVRREAVEDQNFEAVRPNQLWHLDFLHRYINKQKIYILILLDDFSRFIVGAAIWDGERAAAVIETFSAAVARHGKPEIALSDGGSAFHSWRGVGRFTDLITELEVDQIVAEKPQTNGKLEVLNANVQKELFDPEKFFDLGETQRRFLAWVNFYNFRRTHHALGGLLVPADRYFGRAEEVLACIEAGKSPDGVGEPALVGERQLDLFRISSCRGRVELHLLGHRILLPLAG